MKKTEVFKQPGIVKPNKTNDKKEILERGSWGSKFEFILSSLGYAIGFGNVWRFPYLVYKHGGGTFLIPYGLCLFLIGLPLFFLEMVIGQYSGCGPTQAYSYMAPIMSGLGYCMLAASFVSSVYYNVLLAYVLFYFFVGMQSPLPWSKCGDGREKYCIDRDAVGNNSELCNNETNCFDNRTYATEDFFYNRLLGSECTDCNGWSNYGGVQAHLAGCLFLAWALVAMALAKGVETSGKVVYFTAIFPFIVLFILFCYSVSLDGSGNGISFYLHPNATKLGDAIVWVEAAGQIFFSLGTGFGGLITLSSYNKFDNNCHRDALLVALLNCGTSFFAGFVVFGILGYMAKVTKQKVSDVVAKSITLAFVTIPEAVTLMTPAPLWSFMFFLMMITLGLDSMFGTMEVLMTAIFDHFPKLRPHKPYVVAICSFIGFLMGLSMCAPNGANMMDLLGYYGSTWTLLVIGLLEMVTVSCVYSTDKFWTNIEEMGLQIPHMCRLYWVTCWKFVSPALLVWLLIWNFIQYSTDGLPDGAIAIGWLTFFFTIIWIPIFAFMALRRQKSLCKPTSKWLPVKGRSALDQAEPKDQINPKEKVAPDELAADDARLLTSEYNITDDPTAYEYSYTVTDDYTEATAY